MDRETAIKQVLYDYQQAKFIDRDPEKLLALMTDNVIGIGMGGRYTASSKDEVRKKLASAIRNEAITVYAVTYGEIETRFPSESCANLSVRVSLRHRAGEEMSTSNFMQSLTLVQEDGLWRVCQFHVSPIMLSLENTEAPSLLLADIQVQNLRSQITTEAFDLMSASFVGGVLGVHKVGDKYPLYFANEGIARLLGYTVEEFHQVFQEDAVGIFYAGDYDYAMKLTEGMLVRNSDVTARLRLQKKDGSLLPVIDYARRTQDSEGKDVLIAVFTDITELVELHETLELKNETILSSMRYAGKIQKNLLPSLSCLHSVFADAHALWQPKDIVSGDVFWMKEFEQGTALIICDCTGHGTPGALLTMLVASILDNIVVKKNCNDTAQLIFSLDKKISTVLNVYSTPEEVQREITHIEDGCDIAALFVANDGTVTISSSGIHVFVCDGTEVTQFKGQRLSIGAGALAHVKDVKTLHLPANPANKFYIASDGLYDQIGGEVARPFGYKAFKEIILKNHAENLEKITEKIWQAFEFHRGEHTRRDDVELVSFRP